MRQLPDVSAARTRDELVEQLRLLKIAAGDPSFATLARRTGLPASTLADALNRRRRRLARLETIRALVHACGADPEPWESAWHAVRAALDTQAGPDLNVHAEPVVPNQLPADVATFTGRETAVEHL